MTWEEFDELKKTELLALANYYEMGFKQNSRKQIIKNGLIDVLVGDDLLEKECLEKKEDIQTHFEGDAVKIKEMELKMQLEMKNLQVEEHEKMEKLQIEGQTLQMKGKNPPNWKGTERKGNGSRNLSMKS